MRSYHGEEMNIITNYCYNVPAFDGYYLITENYCCEYFGDIGVSITWYSSNNVYVYLLME